MHSNMTLVYNNVFSHKKNMLIENRKNSFFFLSRRLHSWWCPSVSSFKFQSILMDA